MAEFDTGLPSVRQVQQFIKDKKEIEIKLNTDEVFVGQVLWQDSQCLCLSNQTNPSMLIWRQALVYLKPIP